MDEKEKAKRLRNGESLPTAPKGRRKGPGAKPGHLVKVHGKAIPMNEAGRKGYLHDAQQQRRRRY
ncbi:MAG TPA: hypothetical protein VEW42_06070 [Candidatus Eisenbacteria bacterium]|nr:hypothetical protein [Candidatus Eisenbacteria bacterium]